MANHKSALKRVRQSQQRRLRNRTTKTRIKKIVKGVRLAAAGDDRAAVLGQFNSAQSLIDKAAKKGVIHSNTAARKISRLSRLINAPNA